MAILTTAKYHKSGSRASPSPGPAGNPQGNRNPYHSRNIHFPTRRSLEETDAWEVYARGRAGGRQQPATHSPTHSPLTRRRRDGACQLVLGGRCVRPERTNLPVDGLSLNRSQ